MSDIKLSPEDLEDMLDNAARRGAKEALRSIGLLDDDAAKDIIEMRSLLEAGLLNLPSFLVPLLIPFAAFSTVLVVVPSSFVTVLTIPVPLAEATAS